MDTLAPLWPAVRFGLLLAGLLLPGAALMGALRLPRTLATCFAGSAFALYVTVLALQLTGLGIAPLTLCAGLLSVSLAAAVAGRLGVERRVPTRLEDIAKGNEGPPRPDQQPGDRLLHPGGTEREESGRRFAPFTAMGGWTPLYALFWAAVILRAWAEPLAGPDVEFRWGFLAEQMLRVGSLDFYPPRSAADFAAYFWVESIPPGVAALHAWAYACAGGPVAAWAIPGVLLQLAALHELLWHAARRIGGMAAARFAVLAAAACPLLVWSFLIGQETGFTALALTGILFSAGRWIDTRHPSWAALAAGFAVLGASAREYGLVFPGLGALALLGAGANRRAWLAYAGIALLALVWPARVWILTGNPVYSLSVGGLFPVNARFIDWISHDAAAFATVLKTGSGWLEVGRYLLLFAPLAVGGWLVLVPALGRRVQGAWVAQAGIAAILGLWLISVPYTNGGLFYSLRVTSPALAAGALAAGIGIASFARFSPGRARVAGAVIAGLVIVLLPATLALPRNPWRESWRTWSAVSPPAPAATGRADPTVALVLDTLRSVSPPAAPTGEPIAVTVLADSPGFQRRFQPTGLPVVPLWSPQADWLFDLTLPPAEAVRRWRESGIKYLVLTKWQTHLDFFNTRSRWNRPPFQVQPIGETASTVVFSIKATE
jgi:hypothetical protein